jgi:heterotetrameric sarcosine oxidase delta subunit
MGFLLKCPNCGARSYEEFWFGGELRPIAESLSDDDDYGVTWLRDNFAGPQPERWFHYAGCRRWITVMRNTLNNLVETETKL